MIIGIQEFISEYYINGIVYDAPYNPADTLTYAIILVLCLFGVLKLLDRLKISLDRQFVLATSAYILAGSSLRVLEDANLFSPGITFGAESTAPVNYFFRAPLIYFVIFAVALVSLLVSVWLSKKGVLKGYKRAYASVGVIWSAVNISILLYLTTIKSAWVILAVPAIAIFLTALVYIAARHLKAGFLTNPLNLSVLGGHLLDASSTYIGVQFLAYEPKHVVETLLKNFTGTVAGMFALKIAVVVPTLYVLEKYFKEEENGSAPTSMQSIENSRMKNLLLLAVLTLGLAPAVRNTLRMALGI
jgi:uncharacterized membrane protein